MGTTILTCICYHTSGFKQVKSKNTLQISYFYSRWRRMLPISVDPHFICCCDEIQWTGYNCWWDDSFKIVQVSIFTDCLRVKSWHYSTRLMLHTVRQRRVKEGFKGWLVFKSVSKYLPIHHRWKPQYSSHWLGQRYIRQQSLVFVALASIVFVFASHNHNNIKKNQTVCTPYGTCCYLVKLLASLVIFQSCSSYMTVCWLINFKNGGTM